ncbi:MAG: PAS domain S-box protein [Saprospiraceae bacterium]|nr:PAS domain S-box protein [Saprospiraceae bacterium]
MVELETITENLPYGICIINNDLIIQSFNSKFYDRFRMLFTCTVEKGKAICRDAPAEFKTNILINCVKAVNGESSKFTYTLKEDEKQSIIQITFSPIITKSGEIEGGLLISNNITENIEILADLKHSEEKHKRRIDSLKDEYLFFTQDTDGIFTYISPSVQNLLGFTQEEVISKSSKIFNTKSDINIKAAKKAKIALSGEKIPPYEVELKTKDGEIRYFEISESPIIDNKNTVIAIEGVAHNITTRKQALDDLQDSEEMFNKITTSANDAVVVINDEGNVIFWNKAAEQIFKYKSKEIINKNFHKIITPERFHQAHKSAFSKFKTTGKGNAIDKTLELVGIRKDGKEIPIELSLASIKLKGKWNGVGIMRDISERKEAEEKLQTMNSELIDQKEEIQTTLENLKEAQSQLIQSEKMAALGQLIAGIAHEINTPLGAINASINNISDSLKEVLFNLPELLKKLKTDELELFFKILQKADNKMLPLSSKENRKMKKGLTSYFETNGIDEPEVVAEAFMYLKIYNYTNDFLPLLKGKDTIFILKSAKNFASLMKNRNNISSAVEKAANIVFALKKFAHKDHIGDKISTDIIDSLETVITLYHNQLKQGIEVNRIYNHIPRIMCYSDEINQIWTNLIHNAIQAMSNSGTLTIETWGDNENIYVNIGDTGSGIPDEIKEKIFEPFFTTKIQGEGSGLGLDIVAKIIEKHNGKMNFTSEVGVGTTFNITLPINYSIKKEAYD